MRRQFFYDEEIISEEIHKNGFRDGYYTVGQARLVAKYFRWRLGYGDARIKSALPEFCKQHDKNFRKVPNRKSIAEIVNASKKEFIKKASPISITKSELETIRTVKNFKAQRVLLGFLIIAKRDDGHVSKNRWPQIKRIVGISISNKEILKFARIFYDMGLIDVGTDHTIKFINNSSEVAILISDEKTLYSISNLYKEYCGGEIAWCKECGKEYIKNSNRHSYCDECWKKKELEKTKNRMKKYRKKTSVTV